MFANSSTNLSNIQKFHYSSASRPYIPRFDGRRQLRKRERNISFHELKRKAANERERKRMYSINEAFNKLRHLLSWLPHDRKLSKASTLREAIKYIKELNQLLNGEQIVSPNIPPQPDNVKSEVEQPSLVVANFNAHFPMQFVELSCSKIQNEYASVIRTEQGTAQGRCSKVWIPSACEKNQF